MTELRYLLWANDRDMWWLPDGWGYTANRTEAGTFSETEAVRFVIQSAHAGRVSEATVMIAATPSTEEPDRTLTLRDLSLNTEASVFPVDPPTLVEPDRTLTAAERDIEAHVGAPLAPPWRTDSSCDPAGMTATGGGDRG